MCHFMADIYMTDGLNAYIIKQKKIKLMKMRNQIKDFNQNSDTFLCMELLKMCVCVHWLLHKSLCAPSEESSVLNSSNKCTSIECDFDVIIYIYFSI